MTTDFASALLASALLSDSEAATYLDVRPDTIRHWRTGRRTPPPAVWDSLRERLATIDHGRDVLATLNQDKQP